MADEDSDAYILCIPEPNSDVVHEVQFNRLNDLYGWLLTSFDDFTADTDGVVQLDTCFVDFEDEWGRSPFAIVYHDPDTGELMIN